MRSGVFRDVDKRVRVLPLSFQMILIKSKKVCDVKSFPFLVMGISIHLVPLWLPESPNQRNGAI